MQKFTSTAGPIQTKRVSTAITHFLWESKGHIEITDFGQHKITGMCDEPAPAAMDAYNALHTKYGGEITAKNHKAIIADFEAATAALVLPVVDTRTTPEQREALRLLREAGQRERAEQDATQFAGITREPIAPATQSPPKLDGVSGSWMCTKDGKTVEMYEQKNVETLARLGWTVETALDYLGRVNREIHASQSPPTNAGKAIAERLRTLADGMTESIEHATRPLSQNWTPKRGREHASRCFDGQQMERAQKALRTLADHHEAGTVPPCLRDLTAKSKIMPLVRNEMGRNHSTDAIYDNGEPANLSPEAVALRALMASPHDAKAEADRKDAQELQHAIDALRGVKIDGFFPTPEAVASKMVEALDLAPGMSVLEPSAGIGSLCEAVRAVEPTAKIEAIEIRPSLVDILDRKGFEVHCEDFLSCNGDDGEVKNPYDRVIMNPPFERGQDIAHVMHAFRFLKPGGRLVAIVSEGPFFRNDANSVAFRDWLETVGAEVEELPDAFSGPDAFRSTGVRVRMVTVVAMHATPSPQITREPIALETVRACDLPTQPGDEIEVVESTQPFI